MGRGGAGGTTQGKWLPGPGLIVGGRKIIQSGSGARGRNITALRLG